MYPAMRLICAGCRLLRDEHAHKQENPCEGRCCRHFAGVFWREAPVGVEPTMADLTWAQKAWRAPFKAKVAPPASYVAIRPAITIVSSMPAIDATVGAEIVPTGRAPAA